MSKRKRKSEVRIVLGSGYPSGDGDMSNARIPEWAGVIVVKSKTSPRKLSTPRRPVSKRKAG